MTQAKTPGRRPKPDDQRKVHVNTSMTLEQREMFLTLGGSAWLQKEMDHAIAGERQLKQRLEAVWKGQGVQVFGSDFGTGDVAQDWIYHPETRTWSPK